MLPYDPTQAQNPDPLGIGFQQRAAARRFADTVRGIQTNSDMVSPSHSLADPTWDPWMEAVGEASGGQPVKYGMAQQGEMDLSRDPGLATELNQALPMAPGGLAKSNQLGTAANLARSIKSLNYY